MVSYTCVLTGIKLTHINFVKKFYILFIYSITKYFKIVENDGLMNISNVIQNKFR